MIDACSIFSLNNKEHRALKQTDDRFSWILLTVEPPLNGHSRGTGKWPLLKLRLAAQ